MFIIWSIASYQPWYARNHRASWEWSHEQGIIRHQLQPRTTTVALADVIIVDDDDVVIDDVDVIVVDVIVIDVIFVDVIDWC